MKEYKSPCGCLVHVRPKRRWYDTARGLRDCADRAEREGHIALAISYRNDAYRLEHPEQFPDLGDESRTRETAVGGFAERGAR